VERLRGTKKIYCRAYQALLGSFQRTDQPKTAAKNNQATSKRPGTCRIRWIGPGFHARDRQAGLYSEDEKLREERNLWTIRK
jgi:hypothetical protein